MSKFPSSSYEKLRAEVAKLEADANKLPIYECVWPALAAAVLISVTATVVKLFS